MVLEIATPYGLAMTVVLVTWSLFAEVRQSSMVCTAERHGGRSLRKITKNSPARLPGQGCRYWINSLRTQLSALSTYLL